MLHNLDERACNIYQHGLRGCQQPNQLHQRSLTFGIRPEMVSYVLENLMPVPQNFIVPKSMVHFNLSGGAALMTPEMAIILDLLNLLSTFVITKCA